MSCFIHAWMNIFFNISVTIFYCSFKFTRLRKGIFIMLHLSSYFQNLKEQLKKDEALRKCFDIYIGDARTDCVQKTKDCLAAFQAAHDEQFAHNEHLDGRYATAFNELSYLALRLAYLTQLEGDADAAIQNPSPALQSNSAISSDTPSFVSTDNADPVISSNSSGIPKNSCNTAQTPNADLTPLRLQCAKELLLAICANEDWVTQGKEEKRFAADLWTATLCAQTSILYALVHDICTPEELSAIQRGILRNGIKATYDEWVDPLTHMHALDSMGHNWWLVIVCGAGLAAFSLRDELPECEEYFKKIVHSMHQWFAYPGNVLQNKKATFGKDGDYIEFLGYMTYGFSTYAMLETFYRDETGDESLFEDAYLRPQLETYLTMFYRAGGGLRMTNFGDAPEILVKHQHVIYYLTWRFGFRELFDRQREMSQGPNEYEDFLFYPLAASTPAAAPAKLPLMAIYPHAGYAMIRTGYGKTDRFLAIKGGESWNHNHLDAGTFILADGGVEVGIDSGTCNYGRPEYRGYYTSPQAHNIVLFNGKGQDGDMIESGTKFPGTFPASLDASSHHFSYVLADCTGPCVGHFLRFYRHVLLLENWTIFVDDLQTYEEGELEWRMHYAGKLTKETDHLSICNEGVVSPVHPLYPFDQKVSIGEGFTDGEMLSQRGLRDPDRGKRQASELPRGEYLSLTSRMQGRRAKLIEAIHRPLDTPKAAFRDQSEEAGQPNAACSFLKDNLSPRFVSAKAPAAAPASPMVRELENGDVISLLFPGDGFTERILVNKRADGSYMHKNSWIDIEGLHTDAFLVYEKRTADGTLTDAAFVNGSVLKLNDELAVGCLMKLDGHFHLADRSCLISITMEEEVTVARDGHRKILSVKNGNHSYSF